jgi:hypothetical protein
MIPLRWNDCHDPDTRTPVENTLRTPTSTCPLLRSLTPGYDILAPNGAGSRDSARGESPTIGASRPACRRRP